MIIDIHNAADRRKYGGKIRAWLDGEDVTDRCFYFDTRRGIVRLYQRDAKGHLFAVNLDGKPRVATEERTSRVRWDWREKNVEPKATQSHANFPGGRDE